MNASLLLAIAGLLLLAFAAAAYRRSGLPWGVPAYIDHRSFEPAAPLFDPQSGLAGRPDFIIRQGRRLIPVEMKTGRTPHEPYESHKLQLAAYLRLIAAAEGRLPPHGFIVYPSASFRLPNTRSLQRQLDASLASMRSQSGTLPERSHDSPPRCAGCGFRAICDQALGS